MPALKAIYRAENADTALVRLEEFEAEWVQALPGDRGDLAPRLEHVVPFFTFAPAIRKMIYTTNAVEALHRSMCKIIKTRGSFPNDEAALKLLYLAIKNAGACAGGAGLNGQPPWASLRSSSAGVFRDQNDDKERQKSSTHRAPGSAWHCSACL